jgi:malate dehydrogenase
MSRDELISINAKIVKSVTEKVVKYSPDAKIIIVSNPLDIMTYTAYLAARSDPSKVFGMAGILDTARFRTFLAEALNCNPKDIQALLLGGHGDTMVPLLRYTTISGIPVTQLLEKEKLNNIIKKTKNGGGDMINLLGTSAWYAPAVATAQMVEAIVHDQKHIVPCCAMLNGEYGMKNIYIGVPVKLGKDGIEQIIEIELNKEERALFETSAKAVKSAMVELDNMKLFEQYTSFENPISQESIVCG